MEKLSSGTMLISRIEGMRVWANQPPPHLTSRKSRLSLTAIHSLFLTCISSKSDLCSQNWGSLDRAPCLSNSVPESVEEKEASFSLPCPDLPPCCTNWSTKYKLWMIMVIDRSVCNYYFPCIYVHVIRRQGLFLQFFNLVGVCGLRWPTEWGRNDTVPILGLTRPCTMSIHSLLRKTATMIWSLYDPCVIKCGLICWRIIDPTE